MRLVELQECCRIINGSTPSRNKKEYWDGDILWFTPKDLSGLKSKYIEESPECITLDGYNSCSTTMIPSGSLLFTSRAPIGHLAINKKEACTNQGFKTLVPNEEVDVEYLYYVLKKNVPQLQDLGNGATFKELSKATISKFKIPLPPLEEQKKIAAILDAADDYRQKTKALIDKYDQLTQSLFLDMFGDPVTNPKGWDITTIGAMFKVKGGKRLPKGSVYSDEKTDHPYLRVTDFQRNGIKSSDLRYISKEIHSKISRYILKSEEVYISIAGTIGLAGFIPEKLNGANLTENAAKFCALPGTHVLKEYLSYYLNSSFTQANIKSKTMAVGVPKLAIFRIEELPYINAPIHMQQRFVERINQIEKQKQQAEASLVKAEDLFNSLLQKAFKGELTN